MKKSFGGGSGMGGGGGGMSTSSSLRTVQRSVGAAGGVGGGEAQDPFSQSNNTNNNNNKKKTTNSTNLKTRPTNYNNSSSTSKTALSLSSSPSSPISSSSSFNFPLSAAPTWPTDDDEFGWVSINGTEDEGLYGYYDDFVFGSVPSKDEAQLAVSALQQVLRPAYFSDMDGEFLSSDSESGWIEHSVQLFNSRKLQPRPQPSHSVYEAFRLLQTEPSVQRMVISLSTDKAVWDAVLNNEAVQELRASLNEGAAENAINGNKDEGSYGSNAAIEILSRIFFNARTKVVELIKKITKLVYDVFPRPHTIEETTTTDPFHRKLRTSFLLSVVVFLIVAVSRSLKA
ncbi:hypothetical protein LguiA_023932 [Lonicera macranthoides]